MVPLCHLHNVEYVFKGHLLIALFGFLFGLAVFSLAMFFSALFSERGKVYMATGGLLIIMYVLNIISVLKESLADLKYVSFFYYFNPGDTLIRQTIDVAGTWVFLLAIIIFSLAGSYVFVKRDIKGV